MQRDYRQRWDSTWQKESISPALPTPPALPSPTAQPLPGASPAPSAAEGLGKGWARALPAAAAIAGNHSLVHGAWELEHGRGKCHSHSGGSGLERSRLSSANSNLTLHCLSWRNCCLTPWNKLLYFPKTSEVCYFFNTYFHIQPLPRLCKGFYRDSFWYSLAEHEIHPQ